jgi:hypothetical protein
MPFLSVVNRTLASGALCALSLQLAATAVGAQAAPDSSRRVARVFVVRHDIYDSAEANGWSRRMANRLHVRTQQRIVDRELLLRSGEVFDSARAAETGRNLRRLQVFRDVSVDSSADGSQVRITTRDGWTTRPYATYRSSGDQRLFSVGLFESNFLGLAATLDARYVKDPDRTLVRLAFGAPRLIANRISTGAFVNRFSDGGSYGAIVEQPFFSLSSRNSARISFFDSDGRVLRFRNGVLTPSDSLSRRFTLGNIAASHALRASPRGYVRIGGDAQFRRDDFVLRRGPATAPLTRTNTGALTGYVDVSKARFLVARNYRMLGQPEDVDLSTTVRIGVAVAPKALGYNRTGVGPVLYAQTGAQLPYGFATVVGRVNGLASGGTADSGSAAVSATVAFQPHPQHLLVAFGTLGWDRNPYPGEEFDLGLLRGPRAFPIHAFTGDRQRYSLLEYRWTALPNIGGVVAAGIAAFAERGGAWFSGSQPRYGTDAGVGLRFAPIRSAASVGAGRLDLARRFKTDRTPAGWVVVVGTGFTFDNLR